MAATKERIPVNVGNNPVIRTITEERSMLETLLVRNISLLQIEGRFVNGKSDIIRPFLLVSSILSDEIVKPQLQKLIDSKKRAKKPFDQVLVVHPKDFYEVVKRYSEGSLRTTLVNLYSQ